MRKKLSSNESWSSAMMIRVLRKNVGQSTTRCAGCGSSRAWNANPRFQIKPEALLFLLSGPKGLQRVPAPRFRREVQAGKAAQMQSQTQPPKARSGKYGQAGGNQEPLRRGPPKPTRGR